MALKQIMLNKRKLAVESSLEELRAKEEALKTREQELEQAIEEAETEEEQLTVEEEINKYDSEKTKLEEEKTELEEELISIDEELSEVESRTKISKFEKRENIREKRETGGMNLKVNKYETREQMLERLSVAEVHSFYENLRTAVQEKRNLDNGELLIPEQVMLAIQHRIGDYGVLINEVGTISLNGTARIIMNSGTPTLFWTEQCASLQESTLGALNQVQIDGFKLGGYIFVCNAFIEDSMIDFANFVEEEFAKAIAKYKDEAIMNGLGESQKQPEGIRTVVTGVSEITNVLGILEAVGSLGYGAQGEILPYVPESTIAVMSRKTYYSKVLPETYGKDSNGNIVYGLGQTLPDGTPIRISETVPADEIVVGDFKNGYLWADRKGTTFDTNDRLKWVEEQTGFKVSGRHDGKVLHPTFFVRVKYKDVLAG